MSLTVFLVVLLAACLHAGWNAMVKGGTDKELAMTAVVMGQGIFAILALFIAAAPDPASYPWMAAGIALHIRYQFFLLSSYKVGDLSQVYPLARGSAPLIVALISVLFLGVILVPLQMLALVLIGLGIMSFSLLQRSSANTSRLAAVLALCTGCFIAGYSIVDGLGARVAGTALGFYAWHSIGNTLLFSALMGLRNRATLTRVFSDASKTVFIGGGASFIAYALVMWSFTQAPIALVTALRETSIVFALFIGVFVLGERFTNTKLLATAITLSGVLLLRFSGS